LQGNLKRILISEESKTFKQLQVYLCLIGYKQGYFLSINAGRFTIGIHPQSLLGINGIDKNLRQQISERIKGYESLTVFYISRIVEGVGSIAAVVNPQPILSGAMILSAMTMHNYWVVSYMSRLKKTQ